MLILFQNPNVQLDYASYTNMHIYTLTHKQVQL